MSNICRNDRRNDWYELKLRWYNERTYRSTHLFVIYIHIYHLRQHAFQSKKTKKFNNITVDISAAIQNYLIHFHCVVPHFLKNTFFLFLQIYVYVNFFFYFFLLLKLSFYIYSFFCSIILVKISRKAMKLSNADKRANFFSFFTHHA